MSASRVKKTSHFYAPSSSSIRCLILAIVSVSAANCCHCAKCGIQRGRSGGAWLARASHSSAMRRYSSDLNASALRSVFSIHRVSCIGYRFSPLRPANPLPPRLVRRISSIADVQTTLSALAYRRLESRRRTLCRRWHQTLRFGVAAPFCVDVSTARSEDASCSNYRNKAYQCVWSRMRGLTEWRLVSYPS